MFSHYLSFCLPFFLSEAIEQPSLSNAQSICYTRRNLKASQHPTIQLNSLSGRTRLEKGANRARNQVNKTDSHLKRAPNNQKNFFRKMLPFSGVKPQLLMPTKNQSRCQKGARRGQTTAKSQSSAENTYVLCLWMKIFGMKTFRCVQRFNAPYILRANVYSRTR